MREVIEFRVDEQFASMLFADNEGKRLGASIRKIDIETSDPRLLQVRSLQHELRARYGKPFFYGWDILRKYTRDEIAAANCFQLFISTVVESAGEELGTRYDETSACLKCGAGATQVSDLILDLRRISAKRRSRSCNMPMSSARLTPL